MEKSLKENKFLMFFIKKYYTIKGYCRAKKFKVMDTYYGGVNKCYGQYIGDNTFYENRSCTDTMYGVTVFGGRKVKYTYLQLGLFDWKPYKIEIITD